MTTFGRKRFFCCHNTTGAGTRPADPRDPALHRGEALRRYPVETAGPASTLWASARHTAYLVSRKPRPNPNPITPKPPRPNRVLHAAAIAAWRIDAAWNNRWVPAAARLKTHLRVGRSMAIAWVAVLAGRAIEATARLGRIRPIRGRQTALRAT